MVWLNHNGWIMWISLFCILFLMAWYVTAIMLLYATLTAWELQGLCQMYAFTCLNILVLLTYAGLWRPDFKQMHGYAGLFLWFVLEVFVFWIIHLQYNFAAR